MTELMAYKPQPVAVQEQAKIDHLIGAIKSLPIEDQITTEQSDEGLKHHFAPGVYARELLLPADTVVVGKIHKTDHLNIICSGKCLVSSSEGTVEYEGPIVFSSGIGIQKAVYSVTDVVWVTIHVTEETDLVAIEAETIAKDFTEIAALIGPDTILLEKK